MYAIQVRNLSKRFGTTHVLSDVSFDVKKGHIFGIIGPSGSGKTTLLKVLVGYTQKDGGTVRIEDQQQLEHIIGFTTQNNCFYDELTVKENMEYFGSIYRRSDLVQRVPWLLDLVGLKGFGKRLGKELSGGMSRRLDLALSLLNDPKILILDELTAGLDPLARKDILAKIRQINKQGVTVLLSTHLLDEVEDGCDHVIFMKQGKIAAQGHPHHLKQQFMKYEQVIIQTRPGDYKRIVDPLGQYRHAIEHVHTKGGKLIFVSRRASTVIHHILYSLQACNEHLLEIDISKPDLNILFEESS